ncbi:MAG TPA: Uma2 family endonuclease [Ktedonobacterales bacterium]|nr:Uma2 family endonuclease [Ktedonobacterales bacterium]
MSAAPQQQTITLEAFWQLVAASPDKRLEYRNGVVIEGMSGGSRNHALIAANCITLLKNALRGTCRVFSSDALVRVRADQVYLPDVSVTCAEQSKEERNVVTEPALVVEVLSPSTGNFDRITKVADYRECPSIHTILLIWKDQRRVEVHERESERVWSTRTLKADERYDLRHLPVTVDLSALYEDAEDLA